MKEMVEGESQKPEREMPPKAPRWVKIFGIVGLFLVLLFVILHLTGRSPFMHMHHMNGMQM